MNFRMMLENRIWKRILKFIFHNIGICILILIIIFLMMGHMIMGDIESEISFVFMVVLSIILKNALTYKSLYDTDLIRTFTKNRKLTLPFFIFDSIIIVLLCIAIFTVMAIPALIALPFVLLMSISFSIYSLMFIRKIKTLCITEKRKNILKFVVKFFTISFYLLAYSFVLCNFIHPISSLVQSMEFRFVLVLFSTLVGVFVENIISVLIFLYLNLINHIMNEVKNRMLIVFLIETIVMVIFFMNVYEFLVLNE